MVPSAGRSLSTVASAVINGLTFNPISDALSIADSTPQEAANGSDFKILRSTRI
jgi:hypothetical protein